MVNEFSNENIQFLTAETSKNMATTLFEKFKKLILLGKLKQGYLLPNENAMCEMLGIGRSTLREAYTALAVCGLITRSKAGTYINDINNIINMAPFAMTVECADSNDILEFRFMLEAECAGYAAKRANREDIGRISKVYEKMSSHRNDSVQFSIYDMEFHMLVAEASHNKLFISTMQAAKVPIERDIRQGVSNAAKKNKDMLDAVVMLHGNLLEAIKAGDHIAAQTFMKEHISYINVTARYE